jgi:hypothetical protein
MQAPAPTTLKRFVPLRGNKRIYFHVLSGSVLSSEKRAEPHVHGGGGTTLGASRHGTGATYGVTAPVQTFVLTAHEFWLQVGEREVPFQIRGTDIPLREGQFVSMLGASRGPDGPEQWVALVNHSADTRHILPSASILNRWASFGAENVGLFLVISVASSIALGMIGGWVAVLVFLACVVVGGLAWRERISESQRRAVSEAMEALCRECLAAGPAVIHA